MRFHLRSSGWQERLPDISRHQPRVRLLRVAGWLLASLVLLAGGLFGPGQTSTAHALSLFENPDPQELYGSGATTGSVPSFSGHEGDIQHSPHIHLVFWGPKWGSDAGHESTQARILLTFRTLAGSSYNNILSQYVDGTSNAYNFVQNNVSVTDYTDTSNIPTSSIDLVSGVPSEVERAVSARSWPTHSMDDLVLLIAQSGTTATAGDCGAHFFSAGMGIPYGYVIYGDTGNCMHVSGDVAQSTAWGAVHEYAEAATDPDVGPESIGIHGFGWNTDQNALVTKTVYEVADLCEDYLPYNISGTYYIPDPNHPGDTNYTKGLWPVYQNPDTGTTFILPFLWSKADSACIMSSGADYQSSDTTAPFNGVQHSPGSYPDQISVRGRGYWHIGRAYVRADADCWWSCLLLRGAEVR